MAQRRRTDIAQRDLRPEDWRQLAREYSALPKRLRAEFLAEVLRRTGLSRATMHRRFHGRFPTWVKKGRKPVTTAEQRLVVMAALERFHGRISAIELWSDKLGAPVTPSLPTVRRICREWREGQYAGRQVADVKTLVSSILAPTSQVPLPLGPDQPTMFAKPTRPMDREAQQAMDALTRAVEARTGGSR